MFETPYANVDAPTCASDARGRGVARAQRLPSANAVEASGEKLSARLESRRARESARCTIITKTANARSRVFSLAMSPKPTVVMTITAQ